MNETVKQQRQRRRPRHHNHHHHRHCLAESDAGDRLEAPSTFAIADRNSKRSKKKRGPRRGTKAKLALALVCANPIGRCCNDALYSAEAFSVLRHSGSSWSLIGRNPWSNSDSDPDLSVYPTNPSSTSLFLFSLRNGNNGENDGNDIIDAFSDQKISSKPENGTTTVIIERSETTGTKNNGNSDRNEDSEDFAAWMEGLKLGTPIGKMASFVPPSPRLDKPSTRATTTATTTTTTTKAMASMPSPESRSEPAEAPETAGTVPKRAKLETTTPKSVSSVGLRNPLSNLIQFEAMLELAKIAAAGSKESETTDNDPEEKSTANASDVFAVVDRLFKTFQTQEEAKEQQRQRQRQQQLATQQEQQKELLQLAKLEKTAVAIDQIEELRGKEEKTANDEDNAGGAGGDDPSILTEGVSSETTVKDLMELERYVGKIPFRKASSIWDTFITKDSSVTETETDASAVDGVVDQKEDEKGSSPKEDETLNDEQNIGPPALTDASSSVLFRETYGPSTKPPPNALVQSAESILKDTTNKMEYLVAEASGNTPSGGISSSRISLQDLVGRASSVFYNTDVESISNEIVSAAQKIAKESGVDFNVQFAADRAREATEFAVGVATAANAVLDAGYAYGSRSGASGMTGRDNNLNYIAASAASQTAESVLAGSRESVAPERPHQSPLFGAFASAQRIEPYEYENVVYRGAEMGSLAGAVYEDSVERCHKLGHSLVANGTTANVAWMVTDSVANTDSLTSAFCHHEDETRTEEVARLASSSSGPALIRTITIRGFDASDETVDREALLSEICFATPEALDEATADKVIFHKGLLTIARQIYADTKKYIDWASPNHRIVLNGHSVGGSLSVLMLLLITSERGVDYVRDRILRVYSHGSPPVAAIVDKDASIESRLGCTQECPVLDAFDLPSSMVYGFIQPYDPVVRLFSNHDVLYPLVDDLGADGITLYASGPIRSLRPITRAIFQAWNGWPQFRDNWKGTCDTQYHSVGIQHLLLPEPLRYLNDRFISVNVGVPPVDAIVRIAPKDLLPALDQTFPLDTFQVSLVPQAVRSFLHHFYPAYDSSIADYATKMKKEAEPAVAKKSRAFKPFLTTQS